MGTTNAKNKRKPPDQSLSNVAYGYMRVSTEAQDTVRQKAALERWQSDNPDYELREIVEQKISGREKGRLDWFFKKEVGAVLVVADLDRFSRLSVTEGLRLLDRIFETGRFIAVCSHRCANGQVIRNWNGRGVAASLMYEFERAKDESDVKRERSIDAVHHAYELIAAKDFTHPKCPFKQRVGNKRVHYPFWLDLDPAGNNGSGAFKFNKNERWIRRAFELSLQPDMGEDRVMAQLHKEGFRSLTKGQKLNPRTIGTWLTNRQVLGEYQMQVAERDENGEPTGKKIPYGLTLNPWDAVIAPKDFEKVQQLRKERGKKPTNTSYGGKVGSLFEGHQFCAQCGGLVRLKAQRQGYAPKLRCSVSYRDLELCHVVDAKGLPTRKGVTYDEKAILQSMLAAEWESLFGNAEHEKKLREWTTEQQKAFTALQQANSDLKSKQESMRKSFTAGEAIPDFLKQDLAETEQQRDSLERSYNKVTANLQHFSAKPTGKKAAEAMRQRIQKFIDMERVHPDPEERLAYRKKFNQWIKDEGLVLLVDLRTGTCEVGLGTVKTEGQVHTLLEFDESLRDLVGLGLSEQEAKAVVDSIEEGIGTGRVWINGEWHRQTRVRPESLRQQQMQQQQ